ncbi:MAG: glycosyltransferase family 9 protein [Minisyncoccota bacterium]
MPFIIIKIINFMLSVKSRMRDRLRGYLLAFAYMSVSLSPRTTSAGKKLLIVRIDAIGDFILFSPFLAYYRKLFEDYEITLLVNKVSTAFAERYLADGTIDHLLIFDRKKSRGFWYARRLLKTVKNEGFVTAVYPVFSREIMGDYLVAASSASKRIGCDGDYRNISRATRSKTDTFYTELIDASKSTLPEPERNKEFTEGLAARLGSQMAIDEYLPVFKPSADDIRIADSLLSGSGLSVGRNYMIVCPGSSTPEKNWPVGKFAEVIADLHTTYGIETVVCGSTQEGAAARALEELLPFPIINLTGKTTLPVFGAVCTKAEIYIGNDTGTTHIAAAVGLPVVCIIGGGIDRFFPYGDPQTHIAVYDTARYASTASEPVLRYQSMHGSEKNVEVSQVLEAAKEILKGTRHDAGY